MHTLTAAVQHYVVLLCRHNNNVCMHLCYCTTLWWCSVHKHNTLRVCTHVLRVLVYTAASTAALRCTVANTTAPCACTAAASARATAAHCYAMHTATLSPYTARVRCHRVHAQQQQLQCVVLAQQQQHVLVHLLVVLVYTSTTPCGCALTCCVCLYTQQLALQHYVVLLLTQQHRVHAQQLLVQEQQLHTVMLCTLLRCLHTLHVYVAIVCMHNSNSCSVLC